MSFLREGAQGQLQPQAARLSGPQYEIRQLQNQGQRGDQQQHIVQQHPALARSLSTVSLYVAHLIKNTQL